MNVLFISSGNNPDYQCDIIFHGLNKLENMNVYTISDMWYMFEGNSQSCLSNLYGKGFSLYNRLKVKKRIHNKIEVDHFYDVIIYGSIHRCCDFWDLVVNNYPLDRVIIIDGEDYDYGFNIYRWKNSFYEYKLRGKSYNLSKKGIYFKRELRDVDRDAFFPISFAIPKENIVNNVMPKKKEWAYIIPGKIETYRYDNESDYFMDYAESNYAITVKKGGWDCLRHYEILANACIPYFPDLKKCPMSTMFMFPKQLIYETNDLINKKKMTDKLYMFYVTELLQYTKNFLTTENIVKYMLSFL